MFRTDKTSLEKISFMLDEQTISNLKGVIEKLYLENLLTISNEEVQRALGGFKKIAELKLEEKVYGFHVNDSWAEEQSKMGEGVVLYLRRGDLLQSFYGTSLDYVPRVGEEMINFLKRKGQTVIYTGTISQIRNSKFLGLKDYTDEDGDSMRYESLREHEISDFESNGIKVVKLNPLI
jgi:hypothetical protein